MLGDSGAGADNGKDGEGILKEATTVDQAIRSSNVQRKLPACNSTSAGSLHAKQPDTGETKSTSKSVSGSWGDSRGSGGGKSATSSGGGSTASSTSKTFDKVFGSWEEVHPAALGFASQEDTFLAGNGGGMHPASFRTSSRGTGTQNAIHCPSFLENRNGTQNCCSKLCRCPSIFLETEVVLWRVWISARGDVGVEEEV